MIPQVSTPPPTAQIIEQGREKEPDNTQSVANEILSNSSVTGTLPIEIECSASSLNAAINSSKKASVAGFPNEQHLLAVQEASALLRKDEVNFDKEIESRTLLNRETPPIDERETRSNSAVLGPMLVRDFDLKNGTIELEFTSQEQVQDFYHLLANSMAAYKNYAMAKSCLAAGGLKGDLSSLEWVEKALNGMEMQTKKEKGQEELAFNYGVKAQQAAKTLEKQTKSHETIMAKIKANFLTGSLDEFFTDVQAALALNPNCFHTHYFTLFLARSFAIYSLDIAEEMMDEAYNSNPLLTFNVASFLLRLPFRNEKECNIFRALFFKRFPLDLIGYTIVNRLPPQPDPLETTLALEKEYSHTFAKLIGEALMAVRNKDLNSARQLFSKAGYYHISDKRPYLYKALIDLKMGDLLSALKLMSSSNDVVDWFDAADVNRSVATIRSYVFDIPASESTVAPQNPILVLERQALRALIKLYGSSDNQEIIQKNFLKAMENYFKNPAADVIWAGLAIDLAVEHLGDIAACFGNKSLRGFLLTLHENYLSAIFCQLKYYGGDLSQFEEQIWAKQGSIFIAPLLTLTYPKTLPSTLEITPSTFEMSTEMEITALQEILRERLNLFSLLFMRVGGTLDNLLGILKQLSQKEGTQLYAPFFTTFLQRVDVEGSLEQRLIVMQWAVDHVKLLPIDLQPVVTEFMFRWQLDQPIPCQSRALLEVKEQWEKVINPDPAEATNSLSIAFKAWMELSAIQWEKEAANQAQTFFNNFLKTFFDNWEHELSAGVDPVALRTICLIHALVRDSEVAKSMPAIALSERHAELIQSTFSMMAREGVIRPYVIPDRRSSLSSAVELCRLYIGQLREESETAYLQRLTAAQFPDMADLRVANDVQLLSADEPSSKDWIIPFLRPEVVKQMDNIIKQESALQQFRTDHNNTILKEMCDYSGDVAFIKWVTEYQKLVEDFSKDGEEKFSQNFNKAVPKFPSKAKETFFEELRHKKKHLEDFKILQANTPKPANTKGKRFWQLVTLTEDLINRVHSADHNKVSYNMILVNEGEAHFVMKLISEWSRKSWQGPLDKFAEFFHGPEIHIWGKAPRIPHYNAGVYKNGKLENVHLFFPPS